MSAQNELIAEHPELVREWEGREAFGGPDGVKIGTIDGIYLDHASGRPEWAAVNTGLFGLKTNFVPLRGAQPDGEKIRLAYTKEQVKDAPGIDPDQRLTAEEERALWSHYGIEYEDDWREANATGSFEPEGERVRLRKHVVSEDVTDVTEKNQASRR